MTIHYYIEQEISDEARADFAAGRVDEVMADALYAACGAGTAYEMREAKAAAVEIAIEIARATLASTTPAPSVWWTLGESHPVENEDFA